MSEAEAFDLDAVKYMWGVPTVGDARPFWFCIPCQEWIKPGYGERHLKPNGVSCDPPSEAELADTGEPRKAWRVIEGVGGRHTQVRSRSPEKRASRKRARRARRVNR
jgi:hypothetical protein